MIAFLSGTIEYLGTDTVVIDVGGVGYEVKVSAEVSGALSAVGVGNTVKLYTYTYLREDQIALYGFRSRDDLALFKQLITVSGIGPRGGLSLLSVMTADDLRFAIVSGDARMISRAPGIGKKTAERLILDLRDKISSAYAVSDDPEIAAGGIDRAGAGG
jgi:Holliday junction DNA helicase RuvA